jgi:hypothetical protein
MRLSIRTIIPRKRRLGAVALIALLAVPTVAAAGSSGTTDISSTSRGAAIKQAAATRFAEYGVDSAQLRVLDLGGGDVLVMPASLSDFATQAVRRADNTFEVTTEVTVGELAGESLVENEGLVASVTTAAAAYWSLRENGCFARMLDNAGYFDTCYKIYKLINDGVAGKDFWTIYHFGTTGPLNGQTIDWARIYSDQAGGSSAMTWADWGPRGDLTQGQAVCTNYTVGVSVGVVFQVSKWACEKWNMTKYSDAAHYQMEWSCNCFFGIDEDREVAYMTEITVSTGGAPLWAIGATFDG